METTILMIIIIMIIVIKILIDIYDTNHSHICNSSNDW